MTNSIVSGLIAGICGYVTGAVIFGIFQVMDVLNFPFFVYLLIFMILIAEFIMGIAEAYLEGVGYSIGLIFAGIYVKDFSSFISGVIGLIIQILTILYREGYFNYY